MEAEFEPVFSRQATAEGFRREIYVCWAALSKDIFDDALTSVGVKILGCRPMTTAPRTPGPASAPPTEETAGGGRGGASQAMGISALAVCCRRSLNASLGSGRRGDELSRPIAIGRTSVAQRRLIDKVVFQGGATASMVIAGREQAKQKCSTGMSPLRRE